jgi:hypothetical protein
MAILFNQVAVTGRTPRENMPVIRDIPSNLKTREVLHRQGLEEEV